VSAKPLPQPLVDELSEGPAPDGPSTEGEATGLAAVEVRTAGGSAPLEVSFGVNDMTRTLTVPLPRAQLASRASDGASAFLLTWPTESCAPAIA
jgi:hypothetical protein